MKTASQTFNQESIEKYFFKISKNQSPSTPQNNTSSIKSSTKPKPTSNSTSFIFQDIFSIKSGAY